MSATPAPRPAPAAPAAHGHWAPDLVREGTKRGPGPRRSACVCAGRTVWLLGQPRDAQGSFRSLFKTTKSQQSHCRGRSRSHWPLATNSERSMWHRCTAGSAGLHPVFFSVTIKAWDHSAMPPPRRHPETQPGLGDRYNSPPRFVVRCFSLWHIEATNYAWTCWALAKELCAGR